MSLLSPSEAVAEVVLRLHGRRGTRWVGVDGCGAAGKSTLASRLAAAIPGSSVVHIDDFARPGVVGWERDRFVDQLLRPLTNGRPARYQRWDWATDSGAEWHTVRPGGVVICEGVSATDLRLGVPWDVTCWVEAPLDLRLARARERDGEAMQATWLEEWMPSEEAYVAAQRPRERADLVVDGTAMVT